MQLRGLNGSAANILVEDTQAHHQDSWVVIMLCLIGVYSFSLGFLQYDLEPVSKERDLLYVSLKDNSFVIFVVTTIIAKLFVVTS